MLYNVLDKVSISINCIKISVGTPVKIDDQSAKLRISIAKFQNFPGYFIFLKRSQPTLLFEIYTEYSYNRIEKSRTFLGVVDQISKKKMKYTVYNVANDFAFLPSKYKNAQVAIMQQKMHESSSKMYTGLHLNKFWRNDG